MHRTHAGAYCTVTTAGESFQAFTPVPRPPEPPIEWSAGLRREFDEALLALGRLDAVTTLMPNATLILYAFVRMEAVLSSQIEGTQSSLSDLLLFEIDEQPGVPVEDAREVSRYLAAQEKGLSLLRGGLPMCTRLLCEMHAELMDHPSGRGTTPGEIRRSQVWIGGTRPGTAVFVPPPADAVPACLSDLERFLNEEPASVSALVKAGLVHVQFETIHPFLDGNGRIGRLMIVLQLVADGLLQEPLLYPSLYFKTHRSLYYELLNGVRLHGEWERWLAFFAEGIRVSAALAADTANNLLRIVNEDRDHLARLGRSGASALVVHQALQRQPVTSSTALVRQTGLTPATVNKALRQLTDLGVVTELTNRQRGRVFSYRRYVECLERRLDGGLSEIIPNRT